MDMDSNMCDGDIDMLNFGKTSTHYPSSSQLGFYPKDEAGAES